MRGALEGGALEGGAEAIQGLVAQEQNRQNEERVPRASRWVDAPRDDRGESAREADEPGCRIER